MSYVLKHNEKYPFENEARPRVWNETKEMRPSNQKRSSFHLITIHIAMFRTKLVFCMAIDTDLCVHN